MSIKTSTSGVFEGAALSRVIVLTCKSASLTFEKDDMPDLLAVLTDLGGREPAVGAVVEAPASIGATSADSTEVRLVTATEARAESMERNQMNLSRVWAELREYLEACPRSQSFNSIVRHLRSRKLDLPDLHRSLKTTLKRKFATGHLERSPSGRYKLTPLSSLLNPFLDGARPDLLRRA